jgi:hypothetical protein
MLTGREIFELYEKRTTVSFDAPTGHWQGVIDWFEGGWDNDEGRDMFGIAPKRPGLDGYMFYVDEVSNVEVIPTKSNLAIA